MTQDERRLLVETAEIIFSLVHGNKVALGMAFRDLIKAVADYDPPFEPGPDEDARAPLYVVTKDLGVEGQSLPLMAFDDPDKAVAWCRSADGACKVTVVPVFPTLPTQPWFDIEAIWPTKS